MKNREESILNDLGQYQKKDIKWFSEIKVAGKTDSDSMKGFTPGQNVLVSDIYINMKLDFQVESE